MDLNELHMIPLPCSPYIKPPRTFRNQANEIPDSEDVIFIEDDDDIPSRNQKAEKDNLGPQNEDNARVLTSSVIETNQNKQPTGMAQQLCASSAPGSQEFEALYDIKIPPPLPNYPPPLTGDDDMAFYRRVELMRQAEKEEHSRHLSGSDSESDQESRDRALSFTHNIIPYFDPLVRQQTIHAWLDKVDECALIYDWNEKEVLHYALPKLAGHAKTWYELQPSVTLPWSEWKKKLINNFHPHYDYAQVLKKMLNKRVCHGESLIKYYFDKMNLLKECRISGYEAVDCLIDGIDEVHVKMGAVRACCTKPEEILFFFQSLNTRSLLSSFSEIP